MTIGVAGRTGSPEPPPSATLAELGPPCGLPRGGARFACCDAAEAEGDDHEREDEQRAGRGGVARRGPSLRGAVPAHDERDRQLLERPSSTTYEALFPSKEGGDRQMLYNKVSFVDQHGEVAGLIGVITDVTRYKETEHALEASEARFRILTDSSIDLVSVVAEDGRIMYQSAALKPMLGYDPGETEGKNVFDRAAHRRAEALDRAGGVPASPPRRALAHARIARHELPRQSPHPRRGVELARHHRPQGDPAAHPAPRLSR